MGYDWWGEKPGVISLDFEAEKDRKICNEQRNATKRRIIPKLAFAYDDELGLPGRFVSSMEEAEKMAREAGLFIQWAAQEKWQSGGQISDTPPPSDALALLEWQCYSPNFSLGPQRNKGRLFHL